VQQRGGVTGSGANVLNHLRPRQGAVRFGRITTIFPGEKVCLSPRLWECGSSESRVSSPVGAGLAFLLSGWDRDPFPCRQTKEPVT
jgi:hypothetical protein